MTNSVANRITEALRAYTGPKTQSEIARACGFNNPNMLSMIKNGRTNLPLKRIPALCRELGIRPEEMLLLAMTEEFRDPEANPLWIAFGGRMPGSEELRHLMSGRP
jgi:transcriptional regulator with XRE-family HTH domain